MGKAAILGAWMGALLCGCATPGYEFSGDLEGDPLEQATRVDSLLAWQHLSGWGHGAYELWCACEQGKGLPKDPVLAQHFLTRAAQLDYGPAVRELAWRGLQSGTSEGGGLPALDALAEKGDLNARYYAVCARADRGEIDDAERWKRIEQLAADGSHHARQALAKEWRTRPAGRWWLHELAYRHDGDCAFEIARAFETGDGFPKSLSEANDWYRVAYSCGRADAGDGVARTHDPKPDPDGFVGWSSNNQAPVHLAEAGVPGAIYLSGRELLDRDLWEGCEEDGIRLIRAAALTGKCPRAADDLAKRFGGGPGETARSKLRYAECLEFGWGVAPSAREAAKWYAGAAKEGSKEAEYALARLTLMHSKELGVDEKEASHRALAGFTAAAWEWTPAQCALGLANTESWQADRLHHERDPEACVGWLRRAADTGYARAQLELGRCYERGYGVEQNREHARAWYAKAAKPRILLDQPVPDYLLHAPVRSSALLASGRLGLEDARTKGEIKEALSAIRLAYSITASAEAADLIAGAYESGRGAPKSPEVAAAWRRQAAAFRSADGESAPERR